MAAKFIFDERFAQAFLHIPEHRVLGKILNPFSLWHKLQLEYINSPLLAGGEPRIVDLCLAVDICRTEYPVIARPKIPAGGLRRFCWMLWAERVNLAMETSAFHAYCEDYCSLPKIDTVNNGEKTPDMDDCLSDVALYRKMTGSPREEPWNIPLGELYWMNAAFSRSEGADFSIVTPIEEARKARLVAERNAKLTEIRTRLVAEGYDASQAEEEALKEYRKSLDAARAAAKTARRPPPRRR